MVKIKSIKNMVIMRATIIAIAIAALITTIIAAIATILTIEIS